MLVTGLEKVEDARESLGAALHLAVRLGLAPPSLIFVGSDVGEEPWLGSW